MVETPARRDPLEGKPTPDTDDLGTALAEMALSMHEEDTVSDTVERVLDFARTAVDCSHAGVVFVHAKQRIETVASTDPAVAALHAQQIDLHEGPDFSMVRDRVSVDRG